MVKTYITTTLTFLILLSIAACSNKKRASIEAASHHQLGDTINIGIGQSERYYAKKDFDFTIQLDSLIQDSRCPEGANCIWEGNATVALTIFTNNQNYSLVLNTNKTREYEKVIDGYIITLIDVLPHPINPSKREKNIEVETRVLVRTNR